MDQKRVALRAISKSQQNQLYKSDSTATKQNVLNHDDIRNRLNKVKEKAQNDKSNDAMEETMCADSSLIKVIGSSYYSAGPSRVRAPQSQKTSPPNTSKPNTNSISTPTSSPQKISRFFAQKKIVTVNNKEYYKLKKIGKGGSSKVYKVMATDSSVFALKQVNISQVDEFVLQSFLNEITLLKNFNGTERIIQLIDSEIDKNRGIVSIVLELGDIDLSSLIEKNRDENQEVDPNFLRLTWEQMLECVKTVHNAKVLHADLKPANFLFVGGSLKLIDFGIATKVNHENQDTTSVERPRQVGTLNYMSPEALKSQPANLPGQSGKIKIGRPADVWSLGCILYQLVYNRPPFPHTEWYQKIAAIIDDHYEIDFPIIEGRPDFYLLLDVMKKCLSRDPKLRPTIDVLLEHPYLTLKRDVVDRELLRLIVWIQEKHPDFDFSSPEGIEVLQSIEDDFLNGEPLSCVEGIDDLLESE